MQQEAGWAPGHHPRRRSTDHASSIMVGQTIVAVAVVLTLCYVAKIVLVTLLVAVLTAFMLEPLVGFLEGRKLPRPVGALLAVFLLGALLYGGMYFGYNRASAFVQNLPQYSSRIRAAVVRFREQAQKLKQTTATVLPESETKEEKGLPTVRVEQGTNWAELVTSGIGTVGEVLLAVSFLPFLVYFMLTWQAHVRASTVMLFRMENRNAAYVTLGRIAAMLRSFIVGNFVVGSFGSVVSMVIFLVMGLDYWYFLGPISGFLSMVPYLGVVLALIPPLAAGFGVLSGTSMLILAASVLLVHLFAINVLYPKIIGSRVQLNPLVVTISLLIWGWLWGGMGLLLAVPITAALKIIFDHVDSLRAYGVWLGE